MTHKPCSETLLWSIHAFVLAGYNYGGGAGGGRIFIDSAELYTFLGKTSAQGGQGGIAQRGGAGTVYVISNDLHKDIVKKTIKVKFSRTFLVVEALLTTSAFRILVEQFS